MYDLLSLGQKYERTVSRQFGATDISACKICRLFLAVTFCLRHLWSEFYGQMTSHWLVLYCVQLLCCGAKFVGRCAFLNK